ncbi:Hypothetical predicted protein [Octopus vulgaris]|uniref:Uncharacterized protein n=1 Tax=Octopus vulgaris TaxID=6645 RepID=A0AA36B7T7_OCTVU|nr:Hypothetical predicted protein [Octopus vulgaris]
MLNYSDNELILNTYFSKIKAVAAKLLGDAADGVTGDSPVDKLGTSIFLFFYAATFCGNMTGVCIVQDNSDSTDDTGDSFRV